MGQAAALAGPVDVLINNASALGPVPLQLIPDTDCEDFERALQVNTIGPFRLIKAVVGSMVLRKTGCDRQHLVRRGCRGLSILGRVRRFQGRARSSDPNRGGGDGGRRRAFHQRGSGRNGHADARPRDARRRSGRPAVARRGRGKNRDDDSTIRSDCERVEADRLGMEAFMNAARAPRADKTNVKLLVVKDGEIEDSSIERLPDHLRSGDLLVVNDAATLPASLPARDARNNQVELRLTKQLDERVWQAAVFGAGDWRTPTEDRPSPPRFAQGEEILIAPDFRARVRRRRSIVRKTARSRIQSFRRRVVAESVSVRKARAIFVHRGRT